MSINFAGRGRQRLAYRYYTVFTHELSDGRDCTVLAKKFLERLSSSRDELPENKALSRSSTYYFRSKANRYGRIVRMNASWEKYFSCKMLSYSCEELRG